MWHQNLTAVSAVLDNSSRLITFIEVCVCVCVIPKYSSFTTTMAGLWGYRISCSLISYLEPHPNSHRLLTSLDQFLLEQTELKERNLRLWLKTLALRPRFFSHPGYYRLGSPRDLTRMVIKWGWGLPLFAIMTPPAVFHCVKRYQGDNLDSSGLTECFFIVLPICSSCNWQILW